METGLPNNVISWLGKRGITPEVASRAHLAWDGDHIVIPIFDMTGAERFVKRRRNPDLGDNDGPKYKYDKGSTATLYVPPMYNPLAPTFICEGELDCLRLATFGANAVSSTGGAGTFREEWAPFFEGKETYICYDNDEAGYKGAFKVQEMIPHAKIIWLGKFDGKDVTDFVQQKGVVGFMQRVGQAERYLIPRELENVPESKKEIVEKKKEFALAIDALMDTKRRLMSKRESSLEPILLLLEVLRKRYESYAAWEQTFKRHANPYAGNQDEVSTAKSVPISMFIRFNSQGFAKCIWHDDSNPSMKYNGATSKHPNTVKCFAGSCGQMGDVIDVTMHMQNLDFKASVKYLLNK